MKSLTICALIPNSIPLYHSTSVLFTHFFSMWLNIFINLTINFIVARIYSPAWWKHNIKSQRTEENKDKFIAILVIRLMNCYQCCERLLYFNRRLIASSYPCWTENSLYSWLKRLSLVHPSSWVVEYLQQSRFSHSFWHVISSHLNFEHANMFCKEYSKIRSKFGDKSEVKHGPINTICRSKQELLLSSPIWHKDD